MEYAEKSTVMNPHDATARYILAKCRIQQEQFEKASQNLQELLAVEPNHLAALAKQAELYHAHGERQQAEESYNRIIDLDPFDDSIHRKIYDLRQEPESTAGTLEEDWNFDLAPETEAKAQNFDESEFQPQDTSEAPSEPEWSDHLSEAQEFPAETEEKKSFEEDPFADFEETPPIDNTTTAETKQPSTVEKEESEQEEQEDVSKVQQASETDVDREYKGEEVLDESIDDDFEIDRSKFREEKTKFTKLLDDIFSSNLEEEEQLEKEQRSTLEKIANDTSIPEKEADAREEKTYPQAPQQDFEPLMPPEQGITPEEKILQNDKKQRDEPYDYSDQDAHERDERDAENEELLKRNGDLGSAENNKNISEDFSQFLDSLDIREEMKETKDDFPKEFDDPLPNLDENFELADDFDDILKPVSQDDDWLQKMSKDTPGYEEGWDIADAERESNREHESKNKAESDESQEKQDSKSKGKFFTPTLGEIYAAQGQYAKAISVFETLIKNEPENDWYKSKLEYLKKKLDEQQ
jgi:tetratricopeptide (TPR) repeat protein